MSRPSQQPDPRHRRADRASTGMKASEGCNTRPRRSAHACRGGGRPAGAGIVPPVGAVGDAYDNAPAETVIAPFETKAIRRRGPWRDLEAVGVRHPRTGAPARPPPAPRADRARPTRQGRDRPPRPGERHEHRHTSRTKSPPANTGRLNGLRPFRRLTPRCLTSKQNPPRSPPSRQRSPFGSRVRPARSSPAPRRSFCTGRRRARAAPCARSRSSSHAAPRRRGAGCRGRNGRDP